MKLILTAHLETRLKQREIPIQIVRKVFDKNEERYWDNLRKHYIVVSKVRYKGKHRKVLAAYDKIGEDKEVITIHPISDEEISQRLDLGRWTYEEKN